MKEHDKLSTRLSQILIKFNNGDRVTIEDLAEEFGVSKRTIERDFVRFSYLPIIKENKEYYLEDLAIGKLNFDDIKNFAIFSGVKSLFPSLTKQFLAEILTDKINKAFLVSNSGFEDIEKKQEIFYNLTSAICDQKIINFFYNDKARVVKPYKLINTNGIWYLNATENEDIKTYTFSKIKSLKVTDEKFIQNINILKEIERNEINFLSSITKEVHLQIDNSAKEYFLRKKVLSNMKIIDQTNEYFIVSTNVAFDDEILNIVKQWIPYIKIVSPLELQNKLQDTLKNYLLKN
ncbi:WYL domain-containing protein [Arcobacter lacus]|uniref:WYL domain-containing protein n=1 Tax=Aliarcobacter butzleri TaxID=28197 RepID=A0AAW6VTX8_9BACT|nr:MULTISPECIES: WYL domain-containing protein [Arcobacteraceae]MCG3686822.1 WYL domain-containing protein [Aliarcobacter butzleri]MCG3688807.1 WYL domain-containing protein [Aliarcobacter butzleri]MCT7909258.1 WYL domain-containing protein [Arcobacter lacus]MDK2063118.1 WYL domain-containing protein [Aliarcobacter butzleri]